MIIIFKNTDNSIGIITPTSTVLDFATLEDVAIKDVPSNLPYWIVDDSVIPVDRTFRNAWEIDSSFGEPDGYGGVSSEFSKEVLLKLGNQ